MTNEEARKLCDIIQWADGGCGHCVTELMNDVEKTWPELDWRGIFNDVAGLAAERWAVKHPVSADGTQG